MLFPWHPVVSSSAWWLFVKVCFTGLSISGSEDTKSETVRSLLLRSQQPCPGSSCPSGCCCRSCNDDQIRMNSELDFLIGDYIVSDVNCVPLSICGLQGHKTEDEVLAGGTLHAEFRTLKQVSTLAIKGTHSFAPVLLVIRCLRT
ncbi:hypothetical protein B0T09DRAFT_37110 [Sordaria sp. MPI-SDFR-AT-0083]|nr:hypothetical protein B0T09DRAFT_37110 [Sordaria sp. MPI-SDFR-AT-0083]